MQNNSALLTVRHLPHHTNTETYISHDQHRTEKSPYCNVQCGDFSVLVCFIFQKLLFRVVPGY